MIVRYTKERGYKGQGKDVSFTLGNVYLVFGISFQHAFKKYMYTLRSESDGTPVLLEIEFFDIINARIPDGWIFERFGEYFSIEPSEFSGEFWDRYHDGDKNAERIFGQVINKISAFHGLEELYIDSEEQLKRKELEKIQQEFSDDKKMKDEYLMCNYGITFDELKNLAFKMGL